LTFNQLRISTLFLLLGLAFMPLSACSNPNDQTEQVKQTQQTEDVKEPVAEVIKPTKVSTRSVTPPPRRRASPVKTVDVKPFSLDNPKHKSELSKFLENYRIQDLCYRYSAEYPFTIRGISPNRDRLIRTEVLVEAGVFSRKKRQEPYGWNRSVDVYVYDLTDEGVQMLNDQFELCYGRIVIERVRNVEINPIAEQLPSSFIDIVATTHADVMGEWVYDPKVKDFFPVPDSKTMTITLRHTPGEENTLSVVSGF